MSKKIFVTLSMDEIKTLIEALSNDKKHYFGPLFDKLDEIYDQNLEPEPLNHADWLEKYGRED